MTNMGIPSFDLPPASGPQSAVGSPRDEAPSSLGFWQRYGTSEISRLLGVFEEEIETVYPFIDSQKLAASAPQILELGRLGERDNGDLVPTGQVQGFSFKDFQLAKVAIAVAIVVESHGRNDFSQAMVESVRNSASRIPNSEVKLKDVQLMAILVSLSLYTSVPPLNALSPRPESTSTSDSSGRASTTSTAMKTSWHGARLVLLRGRL